MLPNEFLSNGDNWRFLLFLGHQLQILAKTELILREVDHRKKTLRLFQINHTICTKIEGTENLL